MGQTQHTIGNAMVRASCILQLALGNIGVSGGGANIFRGHDNVQGATDVGPNPDSLPGYYGLAAGSWKHWSRVWGVDYEWIKKQYAAGHDGEARHDGLALDRRRAREERADRPGSGNLRAIVYWGHAPNSQTRGLEMVEAMKKLDLLVVIDPYPSATAAMAAMSRKDGVYLLPAATQFETLGLCTASNRSIQWREKVIDPLFESQAPTTRSCTRSRRSSASRPVLGKKDGKNVKLEGQGRHGRARDGRHAARDQQGHLDHRLHRPVARAPQAHMRNMHVFDVKTLRAKGGVDKATGYSLDGDYFGLPWPCYGDAQAEAPGLAQPV
jgi:formate dehydrogenase major subunit